MTRAAHAALIVLLGSILSLGCSTRSEIDELYPELAPYGGAEIQEIEFVNTEPFDPDTLQQFIRTEETHCSLLGLPFCIPGTDIGLQLSTVDVATLARDAARLALFYRRNGYFGTEVRPEVEPVVPGDEAGAVVVRFLVARGEAVVLDSLVVGGLEEVPDRQALTPLPLRPGERFDLSAFEASADSIQAFLIRRGYAYAEVLRNYAVDAETNRASAELVAVPGPRVRIDSILVYGADDLGRAATVRQLVFSEDDLLRGTELVASQRNLYALELVQFAEVAVAADSLQVAPDDQTTATVIVRVTEAPVHVVEAAAGYGSVDCFGTEARWVSRSFGGGARRLEVLGSVSKIGIGKPLDAGLENSLCRAFGTGLEGDAFRDTIDYRLAVELHQPWFLTPDNQLTARAFLERQSEPGLFQRIAQGGRLAWVHQLGFRQLLTTALDLERRRTVATPAIFCLALRAECRPDAIAQLQQRRWRNSIGTSWLLDRTNQPISPTAGYEIQSAASWAAGWLGSDVEFVRWTGQTVGYRTLRPDWIAAAYLRLGSFFGTASLDPDLNFLPPEDRFFAGGANSVRGFGRNELGPGVYVSNGSAVGAGGFPEPVGDTTFVPVGGTSVAVASVELRFPAPFGGDNLRMAAFVDAGGVGTGQLWDLGSQTLHVTPGAGVRLQTPVGPVRVDVAFNPGGRPRGPFFVRAEETGNLVLIEDALQPEYGSFLDRFRIHLAVGEPF